MTYPTIAAHTLGCKVNKYDTDALLASLSDAGFLLREFNQTADIYVINTCTVTHAGDKKSLQLIRRARKLNPSAFIAVCGCMPRGQADSIEKITKAGADFIFDTRKPEDLLAKLKQILPSPPQHTAHHMPNNRTRATIKIQDGCNRYCTYCIVPYVRGPVVSRPLPDILSEAKAHISHGTQEIVITGIQVASYGYDTDSERITLPQLISRLAAQGPKRLRLSSIDPWAINGAFLEAVSTHPTLCSHFHLSLQSGSNKTLAAMNRRYTTADYAAAATSLKALRPNMALTTDIIVGFPGETDEDFAQTLSFAKEMAFAQIHVFEYSPRTGTPAASLPNQVSSQIKSARGKELRNLAQCLQQNFQQKQLGKHLPVLFESETDTGIWQGHTENYIQVKAAGKNLSNTIKQVKITAQSLTGLEGIIAP